MTEIGYVYDGEWRAGTRHGSGREVTLPPGDSGEYVGAFLRARRPASAAQSLRAPGKGGSVAARPPRTHARTELRSGAPPASNRKHKINLQNTP